MNHLSRRIRPTGRDCGITTNWRSAGGFVTGQADGVQGSSECTNKSRLRAIISSSNFACALLITVIIILTQLFIVHHYLGNSAERHRLFNLKNSNREANLLVRSSWLCHSFSHLNRIAQLALDLQIELVIVDFDLLELLLQTDGNTSETSASDAGAGRLEFSYNSKTSQDASHKTVIHLAAINETSGGQPNLQLFYNALKENYHVLKYNDASETMPAEVYKRKPHQLDDVQFDAIRDSNQPADGQQSIQMADFEISKIYSEFIAHLFILNTTERLDKHHEWTSPVKCPSSPSGEMFQPFVAVHLFVLYNYEFKPDVDWIQPSLLLDEIERHKLLAYGVHLIDFKVSLDRYYIHRKRQTSALAESRSLISPLEPQRPLNRLKILEPDHLLDYANNTYLHCKLTSFNISALMDGNRRMSSYLKSLDMAKPLKSSKYRSKLNEQLAIAIQFMNVFSKSYGNFSFWLTGSNLLAYHKFCELLAFSPNKKSGVWPEESTENDILLMSIDDYEEEILFDNTMLELELGLFESELNSTMLNDLSKANMIGVTMISEWREPSKNSLVSFHVKDCPNLLFTLHFYKLESDFYHRYYVTKDNMIYNHKFRRRRPTSNQKSERAESLFNISMVGHHVFSIKDLELCWTRLDYLEPFRVPCDVHEHLRKIYVI